MKKITFSLLASFLIIGCVKNSTDNEVFPDVLEDAPSTIVSQEDAINSLFEFLDGFELSTKGGKHRTIKNVYSSFDCSQTKSSEAAEEPLLYFVNFDNEEGFAIVSGDIRVQPIMVLTDSGNISRNDTITDPSVIAMLSIADTDYRMSVGLPIEDAEGNILEPLGMNLDGTYAYGDSLDIDGNLPLVTFSYSSWEECMRRGTEVGCFWAQNTSPYNLYTYTSDGYSAPAGCVTAAVAQILFYWGHNFTMDGYYFDWSLMHNHTGLVNYSPAYSMIGELYLKLGLPQNLDVSYSVDGSGAYDHNVPRTFVNCGFSSGGSIQTYDFNTIYNKVSSHPIYVSGSSIKKVTVKKLLGINVKTTTSYEGGHAWVIDQVQTRERKKDRYEDGVYVSTTKEYEHLVHCNFGWGNTRSNGFYYSGRFNTNDRPVTRSTSTTTYGERYYYQYVLKMNSDIIL